MLFDIDHGTTTAGAVARRASGVEHAATYRQSWSSDEPPSSNNSVKSREAKPGLWSKLRKQASRRLSSQRPQSATNAPGQPGRGAWGTASMDIPRTWTAPAGLRDTGDDSARDAVPGSGGSRLARIVEEPLGAKRFSEHSGSTVCGSDIAGEQLPPSPTRENPPALVPMVHGSVQAALDPVVYRNTFFNARAAADQERVQRSLQRGALSPCLSVETLASPAAADQGAVRFAAHAQVIPPPDPARNLSASLPSLARQPSTAAAPRPRRPSEPVRPTRWAAETPRGAPGSPQRSPAAADADYTRRLRLECEQLRRQVRGLQSQNELLAHLAAVDPLENVAESVRTRVRTLELENTWLRRELAKARAAR
ncbi:hypothetical protein GGI07_005275 [Coemansia sp. Benny D115]|nr:hypothetical protein GGI07_005275 [Coemansia sp. Benny D115]